MNVATKVSEWTQLLDEVDLGPCLGEISALLTSHLSFSFVVLLAARPVESHEVRKRETSKTFG